jgi:hypothetical protein
MISFLLNRFDHQHVSVPLSLTLLFLVPVALNAQNLLRAPESIVYDSLYNRYLLSNYNTGSIVQIDSLGNQDYFVQQQDAIQGIEVSGNVVYVGCGYGVKGFDLETAEPVLDVVIPGAVNLNDVAADTSGNLYVSDVYGHAIYKIRIHDPVYSTFATEDISYPNGLFFDEVNNRILVCSFRANTPIQAISLSDSSVTTVMDTYLSNTDGITRDDFGYYYVSSWNTLSIHRFDSTFTNPPEPYYYSGGGIADISYNRHDDLLALPLMWANSYQLLPVTPTRVPDGGAVRSPQAFALSQNHPNPFNPSTTISFTVPDEANSDDPTLGGTGLQTRLAIYDLRGRRVRTLIDGTLGKGLHTVSWDGRDDLGNPVTSGAYFYTLNIGEKSVTRKMTVVK